MDVGTDTAAVRARLLRTRLRRGDAWLPVRGDSMRPTVEAPARVLLRGGGRPRPGEVWAVVDGHGGLVVHRYLRRSRRGELCFRGDGLGRPDAPVPPVRLVGRAVRVVDPRGERVLARRRVWAAAAVLADVGRRRLPGVGAGISRVVGVRGGKDH